MMDSFVGFALGVLLLVVTWIIGYAAYDHHVKEIQSKECIEGWEPPVIPSCDQELWERIKDRCGETDDKD